MFKSMKTYLHKKNKNLKRKQSEKILMNHDWILWYSEILNARKMSFKTLFNSNNNVFKLISLITCLFLFYFFALNNEFYPPWQKLHFVKARHLILKAMLF